MKSRKMKFADKKELKWLRTQFPAGCRIVLDEMDDPYTKIPSGSQGTCKGVDDAGNIMVSWDCGSSLNVAYGADSCHRVASETEAKKTLDYLGKSQHSPSPWATRCPRCGRTAVQSNRLLALSRRASITICETCGLWESLEDAGIIEEKPLMDWAALHPEKKEPSKLVTTVCYGEKQVWVSRENAEEYFQQAIMGSEGAERSRYMKIYVQLRLGLDTCTDEED